MGFFLAGLGVVVLLLSLAVAVLALPVTVLLVTAVIVAVAVVVGGLLLRRAVVVRFGEAGYQVRFVRGAGVHQARWKDVEDAVATTVAGERCIVLRLRDGRSTTVPMRMLAGSADAFVQDLRGHLDRGHGYRRLT
jgi:hypothetical protein